MFFDNPHSMKKYFTPLIFLIICSCSNLTKFDKEFNEHKFDISVINNLNIYDSLRQLVFGEIDILQFNDSNNEFTYYYNFDSTTKISGHENTDIPKGIYSKTVSFFNKLGKTNIYGFTISKDSTFELLIRNTYLTKYNLDIRERLYWVSNSSKMTKHSFPFKDTLLTDKWQYQIWYDKRADF